MCPMVQNDACTIQTGFWTWFRSMVVSSSWIASFLNVATSHSDDVLTVCLRHVLASSKIYVHQRPVETTEDDASNKWHGTKYTRRSHQVHNLRLFDEPLCGRIFNCPQLVQAPKVVPLSSLEQTGFLEAVRQKRVILLCNGCNGDSPEGTFRVIFLLFAATPSVTFTNKQFDSLYSFFRSSGVQVFD